VTTTGTPDPHADDRIDELLAGYALRSLTGDDAAEADRLLSEHVPDCVRCRETLLAFGETVADLALGADPMPPPDTLLPRLHRELEPETTRRPVGRWVGVAAGMAVVLVTGGLAVSQSVRLGDLEERNDLLRQAFQLSQRPDADTALLDASEPTALSAISAPDVDHFFLVGSDVPDAPAGFVYGVWLADQFSDDAVFAGSFVPASGMTVVRVPFDRFRFDRVLITLEREGTVPVGPGHVVWEEAAVA